MSKQTLLFVLTILEGAKLNKKNPLYFWEAYNYYTESTGIEGIENCIEKIKQELKELDN